ncbi:MAG TPA: ribonuclease [Brevundimonas sp.]|jgi:hypothetical protein
MTDPHLTEDAREADEQGERPDLGRTADALIDALTGTDSGSDTRAGSLQGGSASGSEDDRDQDIINETLASEGMASADPQSPSSVGTGAVATDTDEPGHPEQDPVEGKA